MFKMSITEMLKYREILETKVSFARSSGKEKLLNASLSRIDAIDVMLDAALMFTFNELKPEMLRLIDVNMFDKEVLALVIGNDRVIALPAQGEIQFSPAEEIQPASEDNALKEALKEILKRNFVSKIPEAVALYRKETGSTEPNSTVWIKIKELLNDHTLIGGWDRVLLNKHIQNGPIVAFYQIKKHLKDWDNIDIGIMLNDAIERGSRTLKEGSEKKRKEAYDILNLGPKNIREYIYDRDAIEMMSEYDHVEVSNKTVAGRHMSELLKLIMPETRAKILTRKEYVEKGY